MTTRLTSVIIFTLLMACSGGAWAAQLSGWTEVPTTAVDLTAEGAVDWAHWGFNGDRRMNHKATSGGMISGMISGLTSINSGPYGNDASGVNYVWSDGTPDSSSSGTSSGIRMINTGDGVRFTVPADTSIRTVKVYVTGHHSSALVRGHLSDGSAADWQDDTFFTGDSDFMAAYVMTYAAASAGQTLTITLLENGRLGDWESVSLHAVTLRMGSVTPNAVLPSAPTTLRAVPGDGQVALSWSRLSGITTYNLFRSTNGTPGSVWRSGITAFQNGVTPSQSTFLVDASDTTATNGQTWHYWVSAVNAAGEGPRSAEVTASPVAAGTADVTKTRFLKILPLGDSITYGSPDPNGGYRSRLLSDLSAGSFNATFVGSYIENSAGMTIPCHEGWPGRTIEQIRDGVVDRAVGIYQPDVILLMIGTNNLAWGDKNQSDVDNALAAYDALLTRIFATAANTNLIVSPILPMSATNSNGSSKQPLVDNFNTSLHTKVTTLAGAGKRISWASAMSAITVGQLGDGVHPTSATYTVLGDAWFTAIQALTTGAPTSQVLAPLFSPTPGTFSTAQSVTLTCSTVGATIRFTTDGTTPTGSSSLYSAAITVSTTTTLKALAQKSGLSDSAVTTATYTISPVFTAVSAPTFSPVGGTYTSAQAVILTSATSGAAIHYTIDGTSPTGSSPLFSGAITVSSTTTIQALAQKSGMSDSPVASSTYTISSVPPTTPTTPSSSTSSNRCGSGAGLAVLGLLSLTFGLALGLHRQQLGAWRSTALILLLGLGACLHAATPAIDGLTTIRIMPLGDSITAGYGENVGGYREQLKTRLATAGYNALFVGSQATYNTAGDPTLAHEGHSGWTIPQITSIVTGSFSSNATSANQIITTSNPDVVMLMIGTNDMLGSNGMGIDPNLYRPLLDAIYAQKPTVRVIVLPFIYCSIFADVQGDNINYGGRDIRFINGQNVVVARQDGGLVQIVTGYQRAGKRISFYDGMNQVVTPANCHDTAVLTDGVHPTAATYVGMGNALVRAIQDVSTGVLDGSVTPTIPSGLIASANGAGFDLAWTRNSANETSFQIDLTSDPAFQNGIITVTALAGSNGASINGLQANTQYFMRIRAVNAAGASANTTPSEATTGSGGSSAVSTPTFSPAAGTYSSTQAVTISSSTGGAAIHYTTDGSTPTISSTTYSSAISVASTTTIKAIATASGMNASAVASATFTITPVVTAVSAPTFSPAGGTYATSQSVTLTSATSGAAIRYTTDGSTPTGSSTLYSGALTISSTTTVRALAQKSGMSDSSVTSATYTITPVVTAVSAPTFSPVGGTYTSAQAVTLTSATSGAAVHYTIDGTSPSGSSPLYAGAITVSSTTTIQALAQKSGMSDSPVASSTFTISSNPTSTPSTPSSSSSSSRCGSGAGLAVLGLLSLMIGRALGLQRQFIGR